MSKASDPFYERKPVPDEFIEHVGGTGLSAGQEFENRERKFSIKGGDLRRFSNPKAKDGKVDPFYQRKQVPDSYIQGIGETGLSKEEEFMNRERKYSVNGDDLRKFSDKSDTKGWHPSNDPYYGRKAVPKPAIAGVGETHLSRAEEFETRENKASLFDLSADPFAQITGTGHRASISGIAAPGAAAARRRSSAVAPDLHSTPEVPESHHQHSGYDGNKLQTIDSRVDDEIRPSTEGRTGGTYPTSAFTGGSVVTSGPTTTTTTTTTSSGLNPATATSINPVSSSVNPAQEVKVRDETGHHVGTTGHTAFYDAATRDLDNIGPHDRV